MFSYLNASITRKLSIAMLLFHGTCGFHDVHADG
jgi:hypothetical protein